MFAGCLITEAVQWVIMLIPHLSFDLIGFGISFVDGAMEDVDCMSVLTQIALKNRAFLAHASEVLISDIEELLVLC